MSDNKQRLRGVRPFTLVLAASLWMVLLGNAPLWRELGARGLLGGSGGALLALAMGGLIGSVLVMLLSVLAWRWTLKPAMVALLICSAVGAYFMWSYRIVIDSTMLTNVLQTDPREVTTLFDARFFITLAGLAGVPIAVIWRLPVTFRPPRGQALRNTAVGVVALAAALACVLVGFQPLASAMRNHKTLRYMINPLNTLYAVAELATAPLRRHPGRVEPIAADARPLWAADRPPLLVLVVGETARSGNFALNGYSRNTTPELAQRGPLSFRLVHACGTSTAASLPCMFSHLGRQAYLDRGHEYENLLDVLNRAGLAVMWLDNQSGCKGLCERVPSAVTSAAQDPVLCANGECFDEILLKDLDSRLTALPKERRDRGVVLVLHQMGGHGPAYSKRSPSAFKHFLPECTSVNLAACDKASLVNAYDNTVVYTDHVLASLIDWLQLKQPAYATALMYVADHGESLGENNLYLHGLPYAIAPAVQTHVPWITWLSPEFERARGLSTSCLRARSDLPLSHDHYFHSVLGLLRIQSAVYRNEWDAYAPCRKPGGNF